MAITVSVAIPEKLALALTNGNPLATSDTDAAIAALLQALESALSDTPVAFTLELLDHTKQPYQTTTIQALHKTTARELADIVQRATGVEAMEQSLSTSQGCLWNGHFQAGKAAADRAIFKSNVEDGQTIYLYKTDSLKEITWNGT